MFLWIGLGIEDHEENQIRTYCKNANSFGVNEHSFTLPQHISLKISFETDNYEDIISYIKDKYRNLKKINLEVERVQQVPGVVWLKIKENSMLRKMHNELNDELQRKYGVGLSSYDGENFAFHSTLFQDEDNIENVSKLFDVICNGKFYSNTITANRLYFGTSNIGKVGTYSVVDFIDLQ